MSFLAKDWQLISDEAGVHGSAEINQAKLSPKVEEMGVSLERLREFDSTVRLNPKWDTASGINAYKGKEVQKQLSWSA